MAPSPCGHENPPKARFCRACGASITEPPKSALPTLPAVNPTAASDDTQQRRIRSLSRAVVTGGLVLALFAGAFLGVIATRSPDERNKSLPERRGRGDRIVTAMTRKRLGTLPETSGSTTTSGPGKAETPRTRATARTAPLGTDTATSTTGPTRATGTTTTRPAATTTTTAAAPPPQRVTHFLCTNDNSDRGNYLAPGQSWEDAFTAQGASIDTIYLLLGANVQRQARIGIYTGSGLTGHLGSAIVTVNGYGGVTATLAPTISVSPGQRLYVAAQAISGVTAYNSLANCFIGTVTGWSR